MPSPGRPILPNLLRDIQGFVEVQGEWTPFYTKPLVIRMYDTGIKQFLSSCLNKLDNPRIDIEEHRTLTWELAVSLLEIIADLSDPNIPHTSQAL